MYIYTYYEYKNILYTKEIVFIISPFTKLAATGGTSFSPGALLGPLPPSQVVGPRCIPKPDAFFSVVELLVKQNLVKMVKYPLKKQGPNAPCMEDLPTKLGNC